MESTRLTVTRNSPDDVRIRQLVVSVDQKHVATLLYGEAISLELEPGPHRLRIHNTLVWKTVDVNLSPGEQARFTGINRAGFGTYTMVGLLGAGPLYVSIRRDQ